MRLPIIGAVVIFLLVTSASSELYTALVDLEDALKSESFIIESLKKYIEAQEKKLVLLNK